MPKCSFYMIGTNLDRALYFAVCKDNDEIYTERVRYVKETASDDFGDGAIALSSLIDARAM